MLNLQYFAYAIAAEAGLREFYGELWGYEDDEEEKNTFLNAWFVSALGRIPAINYLVTYAGEFTGELNFSESLPLAQSFERILNLIKEVGEGDADRKDFYQGARGLLTMLGVSGTQQLHQILTAPDIAGMGSIGMDLGIAYDDRLLTEKLDDVTREVIAPDRELTDADIEAIGRRVYGADYDERGVEYRVGKNKEIIERLAIRQQFGYDDEFVNINFNKKSNDDVKAYFASSDMTQADLTQYRKPVRLFGVDNSLISTQLYKELAVIAKADPAERERIAALAAAETDEERKAVIDGDRDFAKRATFNYKITSKVFYESL